MPEPRPDPVPPPAAESSGTASEAIRLRRFEDGTFRERADEVAREEPLEIRVEGHSIAVTMRTPGHDEELAAGFLLTEGIIDRPEDLFEVSRCPSQTGGSPNAVDVLLTRASSFDPARFTRHVFTSSSCGLCGKATIESVMVVRPPVGPTPELHPDLVLALPDRLAEAQATFRRTGGLHACALFDLEGRLEAVREDVGRHNALDKLLGHALLGNQLPLSDRILFLSGRVSFEMIQKSLAARIPAVVAISAPTSLAVAFARRSGQYLAGFIRGRAFNRYA